MRILIIEDNIEQISFFDNDISNFVLSDGSTLTGDKKLFLLNDKMTSYTGEI